MTVRKIKGEWYVDTYVRRPGKKPVRLRKRAPVQTKRDAEAYERVLLSDVHGLTEKPQRTFVLPGAVGSGLAAARLRPLVEGFHRGRRSSGVGRAGGHRGSTPCAAFPFDIQGLAHHKTAVP